MPINPAMGAATSVAPEWNQPPSPPQGAQLVWTRSKGCCRGFDVTALQNFHTDQHAAELTQYYFTLVEALMFGIFGNYQLGIRGPSQ